MIRIHQNMDVYEIRFSYDEKLIGIVKSVAGRKWNPDKKFWSIPVEKLGFLLKALKGTEYESQIDLKSDENLFQNEKLSNTVRIPDIDISGIPFYVKDGANPFPHQLDFMKYAIDRQQRGNMKGFILADQPGLAKTAECINLALYNRKQYGFKHCLVICCVNSAKYTWLHEIPEHTRGMEEGYILGSRRRRDGSINYETGGKEKLADLSSGYRYGKESEGPLPYFLIMNIEAIRHKSGKNYLITEELLRWVEAGNLQMVLLDEVHKNVSPQSSQGQQILKFKSKCKRPVMFIPMTGTPITSNPLNAYLPLRLVEAQTETSFYQWGQRFCVYGGYGDHEVIGYKNLNILQGLMQFNMLRRLKSDVLDLPDKLIHDEYVENTPYQQQLYRKTQMDFRAKRSKLRNDGIAIPDLRVEFLKLRQINGSPELVDEDISPEDSDYLMKNAKLQRLLELLADIHERSEKVIIFSNWVQPLKTLYQYITKHYKTCCYTGTMDTQVREKHRNVFMTNPAYTVMLGTVGALGTSHTLTAANNIIFYDEPWTPADREQAIDRIYRIGTSNSIHIYTLMSQDTIDDAVHNILYKKSVYADYLVGDSIEKHLETNPRLVEDLLGL